MRRAAGTLLWVGTSPFSLKTKYTSYIKQDKTQQITKRKKANNKKNPAAQAPRGFFRPQGLGTAARRAGRLL